jgi:hypothetical protein
MFAAGILGGRCRRDNVELREVAESAVDALGRGDIDRFRRLLPRRPAAAVVDHVAPRR